MVAVETVTADQVLTTPDEAAPYTQMQDRLRRAALPADATIDLLTEAADRLPAA